MASEALKFFDGEHERKKRVLEDYGFPIGCGAFGLGIVVFINWASRRPLLAGKIVDILKF